MFCVCYELTANFRKGVVESSFSFRVILTIRVSSEKNTILQTKAILERQKETYQRKFISCAFQGFCWWLLQQGWEKHTVIILLTDISDDHVCF